MNAELLRRAIERKYGSIRAFAMKIGVAPTTIQSAIEKDKVGKMAVETVLKMCNELGLDPKTMKPITECAIIMPDDEIELLNNYRNASPMKRGRVLGILEPDTNGNEYPKKGDAVSGE